MSRGFIIWDIASECYLPPSRGNNDGVLGVTIDGTGIIYLEDGEVNIQPAEDAGVIIERSTGFKDKNDKAIWTGDIVKCWDEDCGEVYFDTILLQYRVKFSDGDDEDLVSAEPEVIGNIHENPELLEGEK